MLIKKSIRNTKGEKMNRKIIAIVGYMIVALFGAVLLILGVLSFQNQIGESLIMLFTGSIFLLIGVRGPIQFIRKEKQSERDQSS